MKKIQHIAIGVMGIAGGIFLSACDDFLELTPMNEIVKENYWTEKSDVESAVYGCYSGLESVDCVKRMFVWGEMRSDNVTTSSSTSWSDQQILKENILETNGWMTWECFYQVINRCNTVIKYAPEVADKDPNFTESELKAAIAEVTALRTLCYFYLVRTFRDIPYVTTPSLNDGNIQKDYQVPPTPFKEVLRLLIADLEAVKGDVLRLYPDQGYPFYDAANTSRVTTCFVYALLADLYLWDGQYEQCISYCDRVLDYKRDRYEELLEDLMAEDIELFRDKYPLILEQPSGNTAGTAYNRIFGTGNSFESIFELYYQENQAVKNELVSSYYGAANSSIGSVAASELMATGVYEGNNDLFAPTDCRFPEAMEERGNYYAIRKYVREYVSFTMGKNKTAPTFSTRILRSTNYANWIIYRLTDVFLMRAEAEVELAALENNNTGSEIEGDDETPETEEPVVETPVNHLMNAFTMVSTVYNRANNFTTASADTLKYSDYQNVSNMRDLVFKERRRELLFEGKRWFDLVRLSLRLGDNTKLIEAVTAKQKENVSAIKIKLHSQDALFFPYAERELDANPHLTQNPAYITNETSSKD